MASADTICLAAIFLATFTLAQETGGFDNLSSEDEFFPDNFQNKQKHGSNSFQSDDDSFHDTRNNHRRVLHSPMAMFSFPKRQRMHPNRHMQAKNSKVSSILGSGNFGIIRGGIFADHDDIPIHRNRHRNSDGHSTRTDFFQDFHEFRPSRAQLNNALSNREQWGIV